MAWSIWRWSIIWSALCVFFPKYFKIEILRCSISFFFLSHFVEIWLTYKKLYIFNANHLMSLDISIHLWNHHHNLCPKYIYHLQKFSLPSLLLLPSSSLLLLLIRMGGYISDLTLWPCVLIKAEIIHITKENY